MSLSELAEFVRNLAAYTRFKENERKGKGTCTRTYVSKRHGKRRAWQEWARESGIPGLLEVKAGKHSAQNYRARQGVITCGFKKNPDGTRTAIKVNPPVRLHHAPRRSKYMPGCGAR